jgi:hypothetical protein
LVGLVNLPKFLVEGKTLFWHDFEQFVFEIAVSYDLLCRDVVLLVIEADKMDSYALIKEAYERFLPVGCQHSNLSELGLHAFCPFEPLFVVEHDVVAVA